MENKSKFNQKLTFLKAEVKKRKKKHYYRQN